jgi:hypothetical protein
MKFRSAVIGLIAMWLGCGFAAYAQVEDYGKEDNRPARQQAEEEEKFEYNSSNDGKRWDWSKARIGGNFALAFSSGAILVDATPTFGYKVHNMVEVGGGYKIFYYKDDAIPLVDGNGFIVGFVDYKDFIHGPIGYGRFNVWQGVFLMGQYEMANKEPYYVDINDPTSFNRINVHHLLLGGGYSSPIGSAGQINISLLYNVLDQRESIYQFGTFGDFPLLLNISVGFGISGGR